MTKKTVILLMDAFRADYLAKDVTPFLFGLSRKSIYIKRLRPSFGFCERTEILTGIETSESGFFTAIKYDPINSPYRNIKYLLKFLSKIEALSPFIIRRLIRRLLWEYASRVDGGFAPVNIPLDELVLFSLSEDGVDSLIRGSSASLYNKAEARGVVIGDSAFTSLDRKLSGDDSERLRLSFLELKQGVDVSIVYLSECDKYGHYFGPESTDFVQKLNVFDRNVGRYFYKLHTMYGSDFNFIAIGDHGMTTVKATVDIREVIINWFDELLNRKEYFLFVDSTVAKIWLQDSSNKNLFSSLKRFLVSKYPDLVVTEADELGGYFLSRDFGDLVIFADPGTVFSPDSFNSEAKVVKGMHGYDPSTCSDMDGMALVYSGGQSAKIESAALHEINPTITDLVLNDSATSKQ